MLRQALRFRCPHRLLHCGSSLQDQVLEKLQLCSAEEQVFDVVGRNKAKLTVNHVGCAIDLLWQFQKAKPHMLHASDNVCSHPQFLTLRVLAENKISKMDDVTVVDMLYAVLRLKVEHHDSLVQQLVMEAWKRMDRFQMSELSKFATCLGEQFLHHSPLMGQITEIVNQRLDSIENVRVLSVLMIHTSAMVSPRLRDRLIEKADVLLESMDPYQYNNPRRVVQFLRNVRYNHRPLLEKCNDILLHNIPQLNAEIISIIIGLYQSLQFKNYNFRLAAKQRLLELLDTSTDPVSFTKLFCALGPMAGQATKESLESTVLLLAEELNAQQALAVVGTLEEIQCRNVQLLNKITAILHKNLEVYRPVEIARLSQALILLHCQNPELFSRLRSILVRFLQDSILPHEVTMLTRVLAMLPAPRLEEAVASRVEAMIPQCSLSGLNSLAISIAKWIRTDTSYRHGTPSKYVHLLQMLNRCGHERLLKADRLDLLLEELKYISGEWFEEILLEETIVTFQRLLDQISLDNVTDLGLFLTRTSYVSAPVLDRIASVTTENIHKVHYSAIYALLLPFALLNYDPPKVHEFFDICIQHFTPYISSFDPHLLILMAYSLALADCFPEEVIREIFNIDFLAKLDAQMETQSNPLNMRVRLRLMELNRAVCLECPEFQVPWFHERFCKQLQRRGNTTVTPVQQQIHRMLGEVLGGINCAKVAVVTPYFYTVDFECVLDRHRQAIPYSEQSGLRIREDGKVQWESRTSRSDMTELPPGAQRIALEFLNAKAFCKNSRHMKGEVIMRKRHLEILGYHVVQIPHFEWNSMELSTPNAWKDYLRKKIFMELP